MKRIARRGASLLAAALLALGIAGYGISFKASADSADGHLGGGHEALLLSEALGNVPGSKLTAVIVSYAPGGKSPSHHHAGTVFAYVLQGDIRSQNSATGPAKVYHTGESFFEPSGSVHLVSENASATQPAKLLAVFVADAGAQLTTPQK